MLHSNALTQWFFYRAVSVHELDRQTDAAILIKIEQHTFGPLTVTLVLLMCHGMK